MERTLPQMDAFAAMIVVRGPAVSPARVVERRRENPGRTI